ncbi:hypothetical protein KKF34_07015 [Myxococcota bacterium]|nr:hypothetical protein [Myxococcota bacterium]MBU1379189.1 hypothetical protein [Myxococcota bacterium]MBU1496612.1 hypothetical protein [Myxococcota bacterium]
MKFKSLPAAVIFLSLLLTIACSKKKSSDSEKVEIFSEISKQQKAPLAPVLTGKLRFKLDAPPELLDLRRVLKTRRASLLKCNRVSDIGDYEIHISPVGTVTSCTKIPPAQSPPSCICQIIKTIRLQKTEGGIAILTTWSEE